ncbi:hypothetical protein WN51_07983 [Melipona quadrifasciata]|uniref:Uncharacterized protein n=1 Tax=Melipona quadrifasciata TaxID=166423 RepID=A0A0M8ZQC1_9HYME|nr:hypothetical protein WN51_07983 [Melipona quadrifasciata]
MEPLRKYIFRRYFKRAYRDNAETFIGLRGRAFPVLLKRATNLIFSLVSRNTILLQQPLINYTRSQYGDSLKTEQLWLP